MHISAPKAALKKRAGPPGPTTGPLENREMNTPKLVPWYACKAGVSIERAETLWAKAVRRATAKTGWVGTSEYFASAMEIFQELLEHEHNQACTPRVSPLVRSQAEIWRLPLIAMEDVMTAVTSTWQRHIGQPRKAA